MTNGNNKYVNIRFESSDGERILKLAEQEGLMSGPFCKRVVLKYINNGFDNKKDHPLRLLLTTIFLTLCTTFIIMFLTLKILGA